MSICLPLIFCLFQTNLLKSNETMKLFISIRIYSGIKKATENTDDVPDPNGECKVCKKKFISESYLVRHLARHGKLLNVSNKQYLNQND